MIRYFLILVFVILLIACAQASIVREGEPIITFNKLYIPESVKQGEFYQISADMTTHKNIWEDMTVFLHITSPADNKILINNDFGATIPTTHWTPGEVVRVGPANCYIPPDIPSGTYNVRMGIFSTKMTPEGAVAVAEPYTNKEINNFVVGQIKVDAAKPEESKKKEDLIISNFETLADLKKWEPSRCLIEQDSDNVAEGKYAAKVTYLKNSGCCPAPILESFFRYSDPKYSDWAEYDILQFYIYGAKDEKDLKYPVYIQVKDKGERRFQWSLPTTQEKDKPITFNLSNIGKVVDLTNIGNLCFFVGGTPPNEDWIIYLDDIRLISLNLEKQKEPFVKFEGIEIPKDKVKPGEEIEINPSFSISRRFAEDHALFIHIYRTNDKAGWINADTSPSPPTTEWEVNKIINQGPFLIFIPPDTPPGRYSIEMGLFLCKQISPDAQYIKYSRDKKGVYQILQPNYPLDCFKQPYVNYEGYGDWVVGSFEVLTP